MYDLKVVSLYPKKIGGRTYYYLREMARVDGKPTMVSERYLGSVDDIAAAVAARDAASLPERTRHLAFGDVAAAWGMVERLDVVGLVDEVAGPRRSDAGASVGTYLALAALNRLVAPRSKAAFAQWWATTAADRFTKIPARVLDHRRFWDAMHLVSEADLLAIERRLADRMIDVFGLDVSAVALDMTNFATYIDTGNDRAPLAQRGKAKQKRCDLRIVGLGLVVTRDGGIPLVSHAYPGNRPDVTQSTALIDELVRRHAALTAARGRQPGEVTVVFDAGQNSTANVAHLASRWLRFVGSIPPSGCADLLVLPASARTPVAGFDGLTAFEARRGVHGTERRVILTHSPTLHAGQARGLDQTITKAGRRLDELAATLARGRTRRGRDQVQAEIANICADPWVRRTVTTTLTGDSPAEHRLTWAVDPAARAALEDEIFGKRVLVTDRDDWPVVDVVAAYRSQSDAEFAFRQLKDPHVVSFSPMHHWTDHTIRVHTFTCVLALQAAHLMRRHAAQAGLELSVRVLLDELAGIQETVMIYPSSGGRPKVRRMLTQTTPTQDRLAEIFGLARWAPRI
ncbi:IS1634 family transposase [Frankia sp. Cr2]|uniref:IS1634 family transposase n=1 Tax=Frankia sp. Cr2 TaxID=3073932 RepID=UPI002AD56DDF|nr:IS1634 family transposase [Frankia sp. Cr2]